MCLTPNLPMALRVYTSEGAWPTLFANERGGQNRQSVLIPKGKKAKRGMRKAISVLDRCGNNWKNGKGGCGIMLNEESTPCLATMFQPFVLLTKGNHKGE